MNQQKTLQSLQGTNTARRAEATTDLKSSADHQFINPSEHTLATFRGVDKECLEGPAGVKASEEWKGHEKRRIVEKFLARDEIFFKILQLIPTSITERQRKVEELASPPLSSHRTTRENKRYIQSGLDLSSPRSSFNTTTNNTNINFYINT